MNRGLGFLAQEGGQATVNRKAQLLVVGNWTFQCHSPGIAAVILVPRNLKRRKIYEISAKRFYVNRINDRGGDHWYFGGGRYSCISRLH